MPTKGNKISAKQMDKSIYPRAECLECGNEWKPRKVVADTKKTCSNCFGRQTNVWNKRRELVCTPANKRLNPSELNDAKLNPEIPLDEVQTEIARNTHVRMTGVQSIPTIEMKSQILLYAESVKMAMDDNLEEFVKYLIEWTETLREVKMQTGIVLQPGDFSAQFIGLLSQASKSTDLEKEIRKLKHQINEIDKLRKSFEELTLDGNISDVIPAMETPQSIVPTQVSDSMNFDDYNNVGETQ